MRLAALSGPGRLGLAETRLALDFVYTEDMIIEEKVVANSVRSLAMLARRGGLGEVHVAQHRRDK